jgi:outer membrane protein, heavy metal efflux system
MKYHVFLNYSHALLYRPGLIPSRFMLKVIVAFAFWLSASSSSVLQAAPIEICPPFLPTLADKINISLETAESRLIACNRDVLAARRAVEAAEADRITAGQRPNPSLTVGASNINPRAGIGAGGIQDKTIDSSLRLDQLLERGGKGALRESQADALINAARADLQDALRQQRLALRQNYFELLFQQSRISTQQEFVGFASASLSAAERKLVAGDIATNEANRFRLDNARAQNEAHQAESDARKAALELAKSIGAEAAASNISAQTFQIPGSDGAKNPADLNQRADLVAAANRIEAAEAARALAASIATRDVTVSAQFDRWPASVTNPQGTGNSFSLYFSIPLSVRHANEGEVKRAAADLSVARDALIRLQAQASAESRLNLVGWLAATNRVAKIEREILPLAREVAKAAEFAYSKGATSVLDLLDARRTLKQIELDSAQANADAGKAWAQWSASTEMMNK